MTPGERFAKIRAMIRFRHGLNGTGERRLRAALAAGTVIQLTRACYVRNSDWQPLYIEDRQLALAIAHAASSRRRPIYSHHTAAAIHGLPLLGFTSTRVHEVLAPSARVRSSQSAMRHTSPEFMDEVVEVNGLFCTSPTRTVLDLSRLARPELAVGAMDAALHLMCFSGGIGGAERQESWRESMLERVSGMRGERGARAARRVLQFADGRAESPVESLSRLQCARLGIRVAIQVAVPSPSGGDYYADFEFLDHNAYGEVDGETKYFDDDLTGGKSARQIFRDEKAREDWIRGSQKKALYRWGSQHAGTQEQLAARLAGFGVTPGPRPIREDLP